MNHNNTRYQEYWIATYCHDFNRRGLCRGMVEDQRERGEGSARSAALRQEV